MDKLRDDCNFCYPDEELEDRIINYTEDFYSFVSRPRFRRNHVLVVPRFHAEKMHDIPENILAKMMGEAALLANFVDYGIGTIIVQKFQPLQGENGIKMNHLHVHAWPRTKEDEMSGVLMPTPQSFDDFSSPLTPEELDTDILRNRNELEMIYLRHQGVSWKEIQDDRKALEKLGLY